MSGNAWVGFVEVCNWKVDFFLMFQSTFYVCCCFTGFYNPPAGFSLLILEVSKSHTMTRHSRYDYSERVISPSHTWQHTQHSQQTNIRAPGGICFFFVLALYVVRTSFAWLFAFCPYCTLHTAQTSLPPAVFEPAISTGERLQIHALDHSATGIGMLYVCLL